MKRKDPDIPNGWTFEVDGGKMIVDGKSHWPDCVAIFMSRADALKMLARMASQLRSPKNDEIEVAFCGSLIEETEPQEETCERCDGKAYDGGRLCWSCLKDALAIG